MRAKEFLLEYNRQLTANQLGVKLVDALAADTGNLPHGLHSIRALVMDLKKRDVLHKLDIPATIQRILHYIEEEKDPTPNKQYTPWLARMYAKSNGGWRYEDLNRMNFLGLYDLAKKKRLIKPEHMDINRFKWYQDFEDTMESEYNSFEDLVDEQKYEGAQAEKIFQNEELLIIHPQNEAAACKYGRGTRWCTASTQGDNYFDSYNRSGPMYILIPKQPAYDGEKYQLHFSSNQFMNEQDYPVPIQSLVRRFKNTNLKDILLQLEPKLKNYIEFASDEVIQQVMESIKEVCDDFLWENVFETELNDGYYYSYLRGEGYEDEDGGIDWDRVEKDNLTYLEYNDEVRRWLNYNKEVLESTPSEIRDMSEYLQGETDDEYFNITDIPDLIAAYLKEYYGRKSEDEYAFLINLLKRNVLIRYDGEKYTAKYVKN